MPSIALAAASPPPTMTYAVRCCSAVVSVLMCTPSHASRRPSRVPCPLPARRGGEGVGLSGGQACGRSAGPRAPEGGILPVLLDELVVAAELGDPAVDDDRDAVGVVRGVQ